MRVAVISRPQRIAVGIGETGIYFCSSNGKMEESKIDTSPDGPSGRGPLTDLRVIGDTFYAVGMSRQVYRFVPKTRTWERADTGVVLPLGDLTVRGFNAIDGVPGGDLVAVGYEGEIWRCRKGVWTAMTSPTRKVLTQVIAVAANQWYAIGQGGTFLRGDGETWERINHGSTSADLWGLAWYGNAVYVVSYRVLFRFDPVHRQLDPVAHDLGATWRWQHLHVNDGVLWTFGVKHVAWTEDPLCQKWHDVTP
jgi:hypothetical protein